MHSLPACSVDVLCPELDQLVVGQNLAQQRNVDVQLHPAGGGSQDHQARALSTSKTKPQRRALQDAAPRSWQLPPRSLPRLQLLLLQAGHHRQLPNRLVVPEAIVEELDVLQDPVQGSPKAPHPREGSSQIALDLSPERGSQEIRTLLRARKVCLFAAANQTLSPPRCAPQPPSLAVAPLAVVVAPLVVVPLLPAGTLGVSHRNKLSCCSGRSPARSSTWSSVRDQPLSVPKPLPSAPRALQSVKPPARSQGEVTSSGRPHHV